ncbi:hypothetical protein [Sagittula sp. S175]|uniref:hypothetical protein n=1 Tax=Sagittula sp. S175 TaxID=3415129 RepID=UPI003C7E620D
MTPDAQDGAGPAPDVSDPTLYSQQLERQTFRRRRMVDAACALPFLGLLLWWLPLLWRTPDTQITTAGALIYIFSIWVALPIATGLLIRAIRRASAPDRPEARR